MIVRWGLDSLSEVLRDLGVARPLLITSRRWRDVELPVAKRFDGVRPHAEIGSVRAATAAAQDADGLVALGGGSAIDTGKAVSAERDVPLVSIPTTYSGAEWTEFFGVRDPATRTKGGGMGARVAGIVYDPELTLDLPREQTGGTALNALAHCAEALYVPGSTPELDEEALAGAAAISRSLPAVLATGRDREARRELLEGAMHAGSALRAGMGVGHAMAQALGGRYGLAHGTMNAVCLPPALRFNREVAADAIARFGEAVGGDAIARTEELAGLAGAKPLREYAVPHDDLPQLAEATAARPAAKGNPRPAPPDEILKLLESVW
jgi:maleylacetate reductase